MKVLDTLTEGVDGVPCHSTGQTSQMTHEDGKR